MKRADFLCGLFLGALSIGVSIMAYRLGLGDICTPGPGFIPFGGGVLLGLMSIGLCFKGLLGSLKEFREREVFKGKRWWKAVFVLVTLIGYGMTFNLLGFSICTFLLMILLLLVPGHQKWWVAITFSLVTVVFAYLLFMVLLESPFPRGPFGL